MRVNPLGESYVYRQTKTAINQDLVWLRPTRSLTPLWQFGARSMEDPEEENKDTVYCELQTNLYLPEAKMTVELQVDLNLWWG